MVGNLKGAIAIMQDVFDKSNQSLTPKHEESLRAGGNLGTALFMDKQFAAAYELFDKLLPLHIEKYGLEFATPSGAWKP